MNAFGCQANQPVGSFLIPGSPPFYMPAGSATLTAGLAFSVMAWLVDFLSVLLTILCLVEASNSILSSHKLLEFSRLPSTLATLVIAICFRIIGVACGYNFALQQLNPGGAWSQQITSGSWSSATNAAPILLLIAIGLGAISMILLSYAVHLARVEPRKGVPAAAPATAVAPAVAH